MKVFFPSGPIGDLLKLLLISRLLLLWRLPGRLRLILQSHGGGPELPHPRGLHVNLYDLPASTMRCHMAATLISGQNGFEKVWLSAISLLGDRAAFLARSSCRRKVIIPNFRSEELGMWMHLKFLRSNSQLTSFQPEEICTIQNFLDTCWSNYHTPVRWNKCSCT